MGDDVVTQPVFVRADADEETFCPRCGQKLAAACGNQACAAPLSRPAGFCMHCGKPLVPVPMAVVDDVGRFIHERRLQREDLNAEDSVFDIGNV